MTEPENEPKPPVPDSSEGRNLHAQAGQLRESGQFAESLGVNRRATDAYRQDGDLFGEAEGWANAAGTWRLWAGLEDRPELLNQALDAATHGVEVARTSNQPGALALPLYNLAQVQESRGDIADALQTYQSALDTPLPDRHNHETLKLNMRIHEATCRYTVAEDAEAKNAALQEAEEALTQLENLEGPTPYVQAVWRSGGHMRLAERLRESDPTTARKHLQQAREIIESEIEKLPDLSLRERQLDKLASTFPPAE